MQELGLEWDERLGQLWWCGRPLTRRSQAWFLFTLATCQSVLGQGTDPLISSVLGKWDSTLTFMKLKNVIGSVASFIAE